MIMIMTIIMTGAGPEGIRGDRRQDGHYMYSTCVHMHMYICIYYTCRERERDLSSLLI